MVPLVPVVPVVPSGPAGNEATSAQQYFRQGRLDCAVAMQSELSILYHFLENDLSIALLFIIIVVIITAT